MSSVLTRLYFTYARYSYGETVILPKWIREIPEDAFRDKFELKKIYIPDTVEMIEKNAFQGCHDLTHVYFCGYVPKIESAFMRKKKLRFHFAAAISEAHKQDMKRQLGLLKPEATEKSTEVKRKKAKADIQKSEIQPEQENIPEKTETYIPPEPEIQTETEMLTTETETLIIEEAPVTSEAKAYAVIPDNIAQDFYALESVIVHRPTGIRLDDMPIEVLELSNRTYNALRRAGILSVSRLVSLTMETLSEIRNLGAKSCMEVTYKLNTVLEHLISESQEDKETLPSAESVEEEEEEEIYTESAPETDTANITEEIQPAKNAEEAETPALTEETEQFEPVIPKKNSRKKKESAETMAQRKRENHTATAQELRISDRIQFQSSGMQELMKLKTDDPFIDRLMARYGMLQRKYGDAFCLGMIDITTDEYQILLIRTHQYIRKEKQNKQIHTLPAFICSLFLVKLANNQQYTNDFWGTVSAVLKLDDLSSIEYLKRALLAFCSFEGLYFHYYKGRRAYAQTVLTHAIMNGNTLISTIDFVNTFYFEEMAETYLLSAADQKIELFLSEMRRDLEREGGQTAAFELGGLYKVSTAFKTACKEFPEVMHDGMKCLLFNLDAYHHNRSDKSYIPEVFLKFFKRWQLEDVRRKRTEKKISAASPKSPKQTAVQKCTMKLGKLQHCSYFLDEERCLYLLVPKQEIAAAYAMEQITLEVYDQEERLPEYCQACSVYGSFVFHTEAIQIRLSRFYKNLRVRLVTENGNVILDSKSQLFHDYLIFDAELAEYARHTIPEERFYILTEETTPFFADANYNSYQQSNYCIYSLDTEADCEIMVNQQLLFHIAASAAPVSLHVSRKQLVREVKAVVNGKEYLVYREMPEIRCSIEKKQADNYILDVNDLHIGAETLGDMLEPETLAALQQSPFISICLREKGSRKILNEWRIAVLKDFEFTLDQDFYYQEQQIRLEDLYAENTEFDIPEYPYCFNIPRNLQLIVNAELAGTVFYIEITLPVIWWELNEQYHSLNKTKYVPASVLHENSHLLVSFPDKRTQLFAVNDAGHRILTDVNGKISLADFMSSSSEATVIGIKGGKIGEKHLFELIHQPAVREFSLSCNENELSISYLQFGACTLILTVMDTQGNICLTAESAENDTELVSLSLDVSSLASGVYQVRAELVQEDDFGFAEERRDIGCYAFVKGNPLEVYYQHCGDMLEPYLCQIDQAQKPVCNFYCEQLMPAEEGGYTASAYRLNRNGDKIYFRNANPVHITLIEMNGNMICFTITDKEYDGFLYERKTGFLFYDKRGIKDHHNYAMPDHYMIYLKEN